MPELLQHTCPSCRAELQATLDQMGEVCLCPHCSEEIDIPVLSPAGRRVSRFTKLALACGVLAAGHPFAVFELCGDAPLAFRRMTLFAMPIASIWLAVLAFKYARRAKVQMWTYPLQFKGDWILLLARLAALGGIVMGGFLGYSVLRMTVGQ